MLQVFPCICRKVLVVSSHPSSLLQALLPMTYPLAMQCFSTHFDIVQDGEQYRMSTVMQKTTTPIYLPLSRHAVRWLPERNGAEDGLHVFAGLPAEPNINKVLAKWMATAGINKKITYHTSRHTFATMMLTLGADLYTTSKLLGHANVKTTQIYAKIVDSKKTEAVNLVDKVFD